MSKLIGDPSMTESHPAERATMPGSPDLPARSSTYTTIVGSLGAFLDGYDLIIISGALLFLKPELHMSATTVGWVSSSAFAGMVVGALVFGRLTDRIGRNAAFAFVLALFIVGAVLSAFATSPAMLIAGRVFVGLGIGADLPVSTTLIAEAAPTRRRGSHTGLLQAFWFGGAAVSGPVGIGFYYAFGPSSWRWMLGSAGIIAIIVMILRLRVPESRRWIAAKQQADMAGAEPRTIHHDRSRRRNWQVLASRPVLASLAFSCLFWFLVTVRGAGFNLYTPTFLKQVGLSGITESLWLSAAINAVYAVVVLVVAARLDRLGRRQFILWNWALATVLTFGLAAINAGHVIPMFVMITVSALPTQPLAMALFPLSVEPFPTLFRGTAQGLSSASGKLGGFLAALAFPSLLALLGWRDLSLALGGLMTLGLLAGVLIKIPDTHRESLEDLEAALTGATAAYRSRTAR
jgi:putative MFS transporter